MLERQIFLKRNRFFSKKMRRLIFAKWNLIIPNRKILFQLSLAKVLHLPQVPLLCTTCFIYCNLIYRSKLQNTEVATEGVL